MQHIAIECVILFITMAVTSSIMENKSKKLQMVVGTLHNVIIIILSNAIINLSSNLSLKRLTLLLVVGSGLLASMKYMAKSLTF